MHLVTYFNSIKVRLELILSGQISYGAIFQFHKGTIRTTKMLVLTLILLYFNSIKVRLEHNHLAQGYQGLAAFQFHKGTIRTLVKSLRLLLLLNFNSIKVRLERLYVGYRRQMRRFQFHKGTIRTRLSYQNIMI